MAAVDWASQIVPLAILVIVVLAIVVWLVVTRVFGTTKAGRHAAHFLDVGGADLSPEDKVKYTNQHPGAGGNG